MRYNTQMEYTVSISRYEGPYTKLLDLIEARKLSITEIDLASLADDYVAHTKTLEHKDHLDMSLFLVVASTLMLMKVKSLLPQIDYTDTEEKQVHDLTKKLSLLTVLKEGTQLLSKTYGKKKYYAPQKIRITKKEHLFPKNLTKEHLFSSVETISRAYEKRSLIKEVAVKRSLPMEEVHAMLRRRVTGKTSIQALAKELDDEKALIVVFLSLLELMRQGEFYVLEETGDDIIFEPQTVIH